MNMMARLALLLLLAVVAVSASQRALQATSTVGVCTLTTSGTGSNVKVTKVAKTQVKSTKVTSTLSTGKAFKSAAAPRLTYGLNCQQWDANCVAVGESCLGRGSCTNNLKLSGSKLKMDPVCACSPPYDTCKLSDGTMSLPCAIDTSTDVANCGECGEACLPIGGNIADAQCVAGECVYTCAEGFQDCPELEDELEDETEDEDEIEDEEEDDRRRRILEVETEEEDEDENEIEDEGDDDGEVCGCAIVRRRRH